MVFCCYRIIGKGEIRYGKKGINIHKRKDGRWEGRYKKGRNYDGSLQYGYDLCKFLVWLKVCKHSILVF